LLSSCSSIMFSYFRISYRVDLSLLVSLVVVVATARSEQDCATCKQKDVFSHLKKCFAGKNIAILQKRQTYRTKNNRLNFNN
jgi:hypothetical protein